MRDRAYYRYQRRKHIARKEHILKEYQLDSRPHRYDTKDYSFNSNITIIYSEGDWHSFYLVPYRGMLDKGKIHCSCPHCSSKTKNKGKRRKYNYQPSRNYSISDKRKIARGEDEYGTSEKEN